MCRRTRAARQASGRARTPRTVVEAVGRTASRPIRFVPAAFLSGRRPTMSLRPALLAVASLAAAFGICLALYRWGFGGNRQLWDIAWEVQRGEELAPYLEAARRRHAAKCVLAAEVVAGHMTLREAAGHFRRLEEADAAYPPGTSLPA